MATCYVQATWIDVSRSFYFERMLGVVFWAVLLGLFSYALLRGIADSLTGRMADPSLYGARVREAWRGGGNCLAIASGSAPISWLSCSIWR